MRNSLLIVVLISFELSFCQTIESDCTENFLLSNPESNDDYIYNSKDFIVAQGNYVVTNSSEIKMKAGNVIVLKPNTHIKKGSLYLARIEPCEFCELDFSFPNFFTPNQDGYNDYWKVNWSNPSQFSEISIFDRFGKLIKILKSKDDFWDGKYNSTDLTSTDYWFRFMYNDCNNNRKEYKSHFSLKR